MKVGFLSQPSTFSEVRHGRIVKALQLLNIQAEWYNPFGDYDVIVVESDANKRCRSMLKKPKERGAKLVFHVTESTCVEDLDLFDVVVSNREQKPLSRANHFVIPDGAAYTPEVRKLVRDPIQKLVWLGPAEHAVHLAKIEPFFKKMAERGATLTILTDVRPGVEQVFLKSIVTESKPFEDRLQGYDMAVFRSENG